ncbi:MAG TPA: ribonuclease H family protein [Bacilli bacterium]
MAKYYVVWEGIKPGIYDNWNECKAQVEGFAGAKYKSYEGKEAAQQAYEAGWQQSLDFSGQKAKAAPANMRAAAPEIDFDSISVDVGCSGNPGIVEYKGVDTKTGELLFYYGPIEKGTNNLGEFLAIVHALAYLHQRKSNKTVYSDSRTAISWVKNKRVLSNLPRDASTERIWSLVDRALDWLNNHAYANRVLKWETEKWGEIKADFGRK